VVAFAVAVTLHALWDSSTTRWELLPVAVASFALLTWRLDAVSRQPAALSPSPAGLSSSGRYP
jgi:hypothetical protein